jgi:predicted transcriptional regulator
MGARPAKAGAGDGAAKAEPKKAKKAADSRKTPGSREERKASLSFLLSHPVRVQILAAAHRKPISPSGFAREHDLRASQVAEHFRRLAEYGALVLLRTEPGARGQQRKVYVGAKRGIITTAEWQTLTESVQKDLAAAGLQDFVVVTAQAIETGSFNSQEGVVMTWDEVGLDAIAWNKLTKMLRLVWAKIPALEEESELRNDKAGKALLKAVVGLAAFEAPTPVETEC